MNLLDFSKGMLCTLVWGFFYSWSKPTMQARDHEAGVNIDGYINDIDRELVENCAKGILVKSGIQHNHVQRELG